MPTPTKGPRFGGSPSHQRLIMANLATSLFEHGQITTTEAKAKRLRPYAEHLITKARVDTVANRRQVVKVIRDKSVLHTLFTEIGPSYATRPGGYTRITKIGPRKGDNAPMAVIELVESKDFSVTTDKPKKSTAKKTAPAADSAEVAEDAAEEAVDSAADAEDVAEDAAETSSSDTVSDETEVAEDAATDAVDAADVAEEAAEAGDDETAAEAAEEAVDAAAEAEEAADAAQDAADDQKS